MMPDNQSKVNQVIIINLVIVIIILGPIKLVRIKETRLGKGAQERGNLRGKLVNVVLN